jgi:phosphatidate phosphatase APP1
MGLLPLVATLLAASSPQVVLFPGLGSTVQVTLSGRVLKHSPGDGSTTFSRNLHRLAVSSWPDAPVEVRFAGLTRSTRADAEGDFEVTFTPAEGQRFAVGLAPAEASAPGAEVGRALTRVLADDAPFVVISDFDDTLAVTQVVKKAGLVRAALGEDERDQPVVEGMPAFYGCLESGQAAAPGFVLVSGSPIQYAGRVRGFLEKHRFPPFALMLRELGPSTMKDYKQPLIRALMKRVSTPVVLIGDSGEHDPEVYRQMRQEFPGRVKAIFIRDAGHAEDPRRFEGMTLFTAPVQAAREAARQGLLPAACVDEAFAQEKQ